MSTGWIILIVVAVLLVAAFVGLYFYAKKMEKKQAEQQEQLKATAQSVSMLIIDKRNDVVTLRNLGADDQLVSRVFLFEGYMITFFGALIGVGLGLILCFIQQEFGIIPLGSGDSAGAFVVDAYPVSVYAIDVILVLITVLVTGFLSVFFPVRYLTRRLLIQK